MTKEEFKKTAKEHLFVLESHKLDKNGNTKIEIYGFKKLYKALNMHVVVVAKPEKKDWMTPEKRKEYELLKKCGFDCK